MQRYWLGRAGALVELRIADGVSERPSKSAVVHELPAGGRVVDIFPVKRTWTLPAKTLTAAERSVLDQAFWLPGPWRLLVANQTNQLTANQSSGTDAQADTTGFVATAGSLASSTAQARTGQRSLAWSVTSGLATGNGVWTGSSATTTAATDDIPVVEGQAYTASVYCRHSTGTVSLLVRINWFTAAGAAVSSDAGSQVSSSTSAWTRATVTATAPATAAYARVEAEIAQAPSSAMTIYLDDWQFEAGGAVTDWVLGKGVPIVAVAQDLEVTEVLSGLADYTITITEL